MNIYSAKSIVAISIALLLGCITLFVYNCNTSKKMQTVTQPINKKSNQEISTSEQDTNTVENKPQISLLEEKRRNLEKEIEQSSNRILSSATYEIWVDAPEIYQRENYEKAAYAIKEKVLAEINMYAELEQEYGLVTNKGPNGEKVGVEITHPDSKNIVKFVYLGEDWIFQFIEIERGKQNGITAYLEKSGEPYKILSFKNGKLDGPSYLYERKEPHQGELTYYIEFEDHHYKGKCLGWTPEGKPYKGSRIIDKPVYCKLFGDRPF